MRQVVLDTETTGLEHTQGHRIIEIGCLELIHRRPTGRTFHEYLNPDREIDPGAVQVHGITNEFLADKPRFQDVVERMLEFIDGAELIIHNAPFDVGFLDKEFAHCGMQVSVANICGVLDTLQLARRMHPGQRNSLDALCSRYEVDNTDRELHGALLDAGLLADVYLRMTGGQVGLQLSSGAAAQARAEADAADRINRDGLALRVIHPTDEEIARHEQRLDQLDTACKEGSVWRRSDAG